MQKNLIRKKRENRIIKRDVLWGLFTNCQVDYFYSFPFSMLTHKNTFYQFVKFRKKLFYFFILKKNYDICGDSIRKKFLEVLLNVDLKCCVNFSFILFFKYFDDFMYEVEEDDRVFFESNLYVQRKKRKPLNSSSLIFYDLPSYFYNL